MSVSTVLRVLDRYYKDYSVKRNYLPPHLCFDEFKSTKDAEGAMSFIFCDSETHKIIDIVENRQLRSLKRYFDLYPPKVRNTVKTIVIDMYSPYMTLIKDMFPNAKIIIDRFHIIQLFNRSLNKIRIQVMNSIKSKDKALYNKYKRCYKLLLKQYGKLSLKCERHSLFKKFISEKAIVDYLLDHNQE